LLSLLLLGGCALLEEGAWMGRPAGALARPGDCDMKVDPGVEMRGCAMVRGWCVF